MKIVSCLKDTELKISETVEVEGINIAVRILGTDDKKLYLGEIPSIYKGKTIFYTQIGSCLYIGTEDITSSIIFIYVIEQEIKNNRLSIKNIYSDTLVGESNILARFFKYDKEFQQENLKTRLLNVIDEIPVIIEKDYLKEKIEEYLSVTDLSEVTETNKEYSKMLGKHNEKPIEYKGKVYKSVSEFCREYDIKSPTFYYYQSKGYSLDEMIEKRNRPYKEKYGGKRHGHEIEYNGVVYPSLQKLSDYLNIPQATFCRKISQGKSVEQIIEEDKQNKAGIRDHYSCKGKKTTKTYLYEGTEMTLRELADLSEIDYKILFNRINCYGWTVERAVETPVEERK